MKWHNHLSTLSIACRGCRECEESSFIFRLVDKLPCFEIEYNDDCHIKTLNMFILICIEHLCSILNFAPFSPTAIELW